jgi:hypothetical protein
MSVIEALLEKRQWVANHLSEKLTKFVLYTQKNRPIIINVADKQAG